MLRGALKLYKKFVNKVLVKRQYDLKMCPLKNVVHETRCKIYKNLAQTAINNLSSQIYQVELQSLNLCKVNFFHFLTNYEKGN